MSDGARILIVDDDLDMLHLMGVRLSAAGYQVSAAESGESALISFRSNRPQMVITDLRMGEMDGLALFDHLQLEAPTMPVIILTAHGTIPDAVAATRRGVFSFLTKPFDGQELMRRVADAIRLSHWIQTKYRLSGARRSSRPVFAWKICCARPCGSVRRAERRSLSAFAATCLDRRVLAVGGDGEGADAGGGRVCGVMRLRGSFARGRIEASVRHARRRSGRRSGRRATRGADREKRKYRSAHKSRHAGMRKRGHVRHGKVR